MIGACDPAYQTLWRQQEHIGVWVPAAKRDHERLPFWHLRLADRMSHSGDLAESAPTRCEDAD